MAEYEIGDEVEVLMPVMTYMERDAGSERLDAGDAEANTPYDWFPGVLVDVHPKDLYEIELLDPTAESRRRVLVTKDELCPVPAAS